MSIESRCVQGPRSSFESRFIGAERNVYSGSYVGGASWPDTPDESGNYNIEGRKSCLF